MGASVNPDRLRELVASKDVASLEATLIQLADAGGNCKPAVVALIDVATNEAWDAIGRFLSQKQTAVVSFTIADLEEVKSAGACRALGAALGNANATIRRAAVRALARQDAGPSLVHLLRGSRDPDLDVKSAAIAMVVQAMGAEPSELDGIPERVLDGAMALLSDRKPYEMIEDTYPENVRIVAARRLANAGDEECAEIFVNMIVSETGRLQDVCWSGLERCQELRDTQLLGLLSGEDPATTARGLRLFARVGGPEDAGMFAAMARDPSIDVRREAFSGLARLDGANCLETLSSGLHDAEEIRHLVVDLLGEIEESTPFLLAAVEHRDVEVRKGALTHLARRDVISDHLMPRYFEFLSGGADCSKQSDALYIESLAVVAKAIGKGQMVEGLEPLSKLACSVLRRLRRAAVSALMEYEPKLRADALASLASTYDQDVLRNVALGLAEAEDERAVIPMIRVTRECRGTAVKKAKQFLAEVDDLSNCDYLIALLRQDYASVRRFGAEQLFILRDPESIPALLEVSRDEDVEVQLAVFEALSPFAADSRPVTDRMLEAIGYGDVSVRQAACEALGEARCKEAVPALVKALQNCFLRPRATDAIRRIGDRLGMLAIKRVERRERMFRRKPPRGAASRPKRKAI